MTRKSHIIIGPFKIIQVPFLLLIWVTLAVIGCSGENASPVDGNGFIQEPAEVTVGTPIVWRIKYTVGAPVAKGGEFLLRFEHPYYFNTFENWQPVPDENNEIPVTATAKSGTALTVEISEKGWHYPTLKIGCPQGLKGGDRIIITMGEKNGQASAKAPVASTPQFSLLLLVDRTAQGKYERISPAYSTVVNPGKPSRLEIVAPSQAQVNSEVPVTLRLLDRFGNIAAPHQTMDFELSPYSDTPYGPPEKVSFAPGEAGYKIVNLKVKSEPGILRIKGKIPGDTFKSLSNPISVTINPPEQKIYWGDMQGHSSISDGAGTGEEYYRMMTGPAALDFGTLSDHEWQILPDQWSEIQGLCEKYYQPGKFVPLLSWEYSLGGHRLVYYKDCSYTPKVSFTGPKQMWEVEYNHEQIHSWTMNEQGKPWLDFGNMEQLYSSNEGIDSIIVPHTSATLDMGNDWDAHDPQKVPLVEIYSVHGSNEDADSPKKVNGWVDRGSVRTALSRGFRLGFIAGGDSHDGKPGRPIWGKYSGGLTAIMAKRLDRDSVWSALKNKRTYATTGARILLGVSINGRRFSEKVEVDNSLCLQMDVNGTDNIEKVDLVSNGQVISTDHPGTMDFSRTFCDVTFSGIAYYYFRVIQTDGQMAWSSPLWAVSPDVPWVKNLNAKVDQGKITISWDEGAHQGVGHFEILKRRGNDGGQVAGKYRKVATLPSLTGIRKYIDEENYLPGITYYYMLHWVAKPGNTFSLGLVSVEHPIVEGSNDGKIRINYAAEKPGEVSVLIYDLASKLVHRFTVDVVSPGEYQFFWNGKDESGEPCKGLHFYTIESEGFSSQRKPIRLSR